MELKQLIDFGLTFSCQVPFNLRPVRGWSFLNERPFSNSVILRVLSFKFLMSQRDAYSLKRKVVEHVALELSGIWRQLGRPPCTEGVRWVIAGGPTAHVCSPIC